jgi:hypothetical protein
VFERSLDSPGFRQFADFDFFWVDDYTRDKVVKVFISEYKFIAYSRQVVSGRPSPAFVSVLTSKSVAARKTPPRFRAKTQKK